MARLAFFHPPRDNWLRASLGNHRRAELTSKNGNYFHSLSSSSQFRQQNCAPFKGAEQNTFLIVCSNHFSSAEDEASPWGEISPRLRALKDCSVAAHDRPVCIALVATAGQSSVDWIALLAASSSRSCAHNKHRVDDYWISFLTSMWGGEDVRMSSTRLSIRRGL